MFPPHQHLSSTGPPVKEESIAAGPTQTARPEFNSRALFPCIHFQNERPRGKHYWFPIYNDDTRFFFKTDRLQQNTKTKRQVSVKRNMECRGGRQLCTGGGAGPSARRPGACRPFSLTSSRGAPPAPCRAAFSGLCPCLIVNNAPTLTCQTPVRPLGTSQSITSSTTAVPRHAPRPRRESPSLLLPCTPETAHSTLDSNSYPVLSLATQRSEALL